MEFEKSELEDDLYHSFTIHFQLHKIPIETQNNCSKNTFYDLRTQKSLNLGIIKIICLAFTYRGQMYYINYPIYQQLKKIRAQLQAQSNQERSRAV